MLLGGGKSLMALVRSRLSWKPFSETMYPANFPVGAARRCFSCLIPHCSRLPFWRLLSAVVCAHRTFRRRWWGPPCIWLYKGCGRKCRGIVGRNRRLRCKCPSGGGYTDGGPLLSRTLWVPLNPRRVHIGGSLECVDDSEISHSLRDRSYSLEWGWNIKFCSDEPLVQWSEVGAQPDPTVFLWDYHCSLDPWGSDLRWYFAEYTLRYLFC